jgi:hypothetical protein
LLEDRLMGFCNLQKRRRAAKLQVLANKKARVSLDLPQTPTKATM